MIAGLEPVQVHQLQFACLALSLLLVAWSSWREYFAETLLAMSIVVLASWLQPIDALALLAFLVPPYFLVRHRWGRPEVPGSGVLAAFIVWEVLLFVYLRKYEWVDFAAWMEHPVAIIGLSYMLFRVIQLVVEAPYLADHPFGPVRYAAFVLAFWTLLSGPIQDYRGFSRGLEQIGWPGTDEFLRQGHRVINGLLKAFVVAPIFLKSSDLGLLQQPQANWLDAAIVFYSYPIYLYLNFSGYTDVIVGLSRACGMTTMPENFKKPYLARNVQDFWMRWHMSFGVWIRQFVFNPLSRFLLRHAPRRFETLALALALIATFVIVGGWHGTSLNFIVFGLLHGTAIIVALAFAQILRKIVGSERKKRIDRNTYVRALSIFVCFHFVCATILLFPNSVEDLVSATRLLLRLT